MFKSILLISALWLLLPGLPAAGQKVNNDGFQRHNGQMHVLRNGQLRPMTRDAHLPTGATVTKDGFIVGANGQRTELAEGQGCDLRGRPVTVVPAAGGKLALATPAAKKSRRAAAAPMVNEARAVLGELLGRGYEQDQEQGEDDEKYEEKAREQRKKQEEWAREARKRQEEYYRERGKKWKEKKKKGKKWDD